MPSGFHLCLHISNLRPFEGHHRQNKHLDPAVVQQPFINIWIVQSVVLHSCKFWRLCFRNSRQVPVHRDRFWCSVVLGWRFLSSSGCSHIWCMSNWNGYLWMLRFECAVYSWDFDNVRFCYWSGYNFQRTRYSSGTNYSIREMVKPFFSRHKLH